MAVALIAAASPLANPASAQLTPKNFVVEAKHCTSQGSSPIRVVAGAAVGVDFNGDGVGDAAFGTPFHDNESVVAQGGNVNVVYGQAGVAPSVTTQGGFQIGKPFGGLQSQFILADTADHLLTQTGIAGTAAVPATVPPGGVFRRFGYSLAAGDFNGDGNSDLAIGIPGDAPGGVNGAGAVIIVYGTAGAGNGLVADARVEYIHQGLLPGGAANNKTGDNFGHTLAVGNFNGDSNGVRPIEDLAVAAVGKDASTTNIDVGNVTVMHGTATDGLLNVTGDAFAGLAPITLQQGVGGLKLSSQKSDLMGTALSAGDANGDRFDELAIGIPHKDLSGKANAGAGLVVYGTAAGLKTTKSAGAPLDNQAFHQGTSPVSGMTNLLGSFETGDMAFCSLAWGNFAGDFSAAGNPIESLAIGAPLENIGSISNAGAVNVVYGSEFFSATQPGGLDKSAGLQGGGNQVLHQGNMGAVATNAANEEFGLAVRAVNFDPTGFGAGAAEELVIGAPGDLDGTNAAGSVYVIGGVPGYGLVPLSSNTYKLNQSTQGTIRRSEAGDRFGSSIGFGDFDDDGGMDMFGTMPDDSACFDFQELSEWLSLISATDPVLQELGTLDENPTAGAALVMYRGNNSATSTTRPGGGNGPTVANFGLFSQSMSQCDSIFDPLFLFGVLDGVFGLEGTEQEDAHFGYSST